MDFVSVGVTTKGARVIIGPNFKVIRSKDLMIRGKAFYAVWDEGAGRWSTDEYDVQRLVDDEIRAFAKTQPYPDAEVHYLRNNNSGEWSKFTKYCKLLPDNYHELDNNITFPSDPPGKNSYHSKVASYSPTPGTPVAYNDLMSVLYSDEERTKIEWAIGSILVGDGKKIQKFMVLYGDKGTGKSTVLNIVHRLFEGYSVSFDAGALTTNTNAFSMEVFRSNPLVAIQHDGDLSRIESNTKLNSIVSHEMLGMNEKYKSTYDMRINAFLFLGTNEPVKITNARSGLIRRVLDASPTGNLVPEDEYDRLVEQIEFELGYIAQHCIDVYKSMGRNYYNTYRPRQMMWKTDIFFNFVMENLDVLTNQEGIGLQQAYDLYKAYCGDALIEKPWPRHKVREELLAYFNDYDEAEKWFSRFKQDKLTTAKTAKTEIDPLALTRTKSLLDDILADCPAQLATSRGKTIKPSMSWDNVWTTLKDIDTGQTHYVQVPQNHIVIDLDLKDETGHKSLSRNLSAAKQFPTTYTEISNGGHGLHLHYIYEGDTALLAPKVMDDIEIKVFVGNSSLRRKVTKCNGEPVRHITGGLPLKETKPVINQVAVENEKHIRALILKGLHKEVHPGTKSNCDFIYMVLDEAYKNGVAYDVTDLYPKLISFASKSTNQPQYCLALVMKMKLKSEEEPETNEEDAPDEIIFFDVEVYPNLFVVVWRRLGSKQKVEMINPTSQQIAELFKFKLVGFNNRRYDNHILYARYLGYTNEELYRVSQNIINEGQGFFMEAYDISYLDLFDISSKKQSLKRFELELGILHLELDIPWDQPVPEDQWATVVNYCGNDVDATEATYHDRAEDISARLLLSQLSGLSPNKPTRLHASKIIFGNTNKSQNLVYTDLSEMFPGYAYSYGKSTYRGENPSEGGYVYAEPGMYSDVTVIDVASMHPTSIIALNLFGEHTKNFADIVEARLAVKHNDIEKLHTLLMGTLEPYLGDKDSMDRLAYSLKIVVNMIYGFTSATFENAFRDPRNKDNIVAKRGALFMIDLKNAVQERGFTVAHIKTDSIKIPNATPEIVAFVIEFGKKYGYSFEVENTTDTIETWLKANGYYDVIPKNKGEYTRFCLVNDAVYAAYVQRGMKQKDGSIKYWETVGAQFLHPVVYKRLLSHEKLTMVDYRETKSVTASSMYICYQNDRRFIGKIGQFVPVIEGGGEIMRTKDDKLYAVAGTKGYLWEEASLITEVSQLDMRYYDGLIDDAIATFAKFGDAGIFLEWEWENAKRTSE